MDCASRFYSIQLSHIINNLFNNERLLTTILFIAYYLSTSFHIYFTFGKDCSHDNKSCEFSIYIRTVHISVHVSFSLSYSQFLYSIVQCIIHTPNSAAHFLHVYFQLFLVNAFSFRFSMPTKHLLRDPSVTSDVAVLYAHCNAKFYPMVRNPYTVNQSGDYLVSKRLVAGAKRLHEERVKGGRVMVENRLSYLWVEIDAYKFHATV